MCQEKKAVKSVLLQSTKGWNGNKLLRLICSKCMNYETLTHRYMDKHTHTNTHSLFHSVLSDKGGIEQDFFILFNSTFVSDNSCHML